MTEPTETCTYCGDEYPAARAEIGYAYCMKKPCVEKGKAAKAAGAEPSSFEWTAADTNRF